jgi:DNA-directed RNA polymerase subunit RPC12/RpoP
MVPLVMRSGMDWVCEYCGEEGETDEPIDQVQCERCGEPVVPK